MCIYFSFLCISSSYSKEVISANRYIVPTTTLQRGICKPQRNIFYLKTNKCGSTTISSMLHRYGENNNLTAMFPCRGIEGPHYHIGWPNLLELNHIYQYTDRTINYVVEHLVFNEALLKGLMPKDTVYVASIREPLDHLKSIINYYQLEQYYGLQKNENGPVEEFLGNISKYEKPYVFNGQITYTGSVIFTKNLLAHDFGFPRKFSNDSAYIHKWVDHISKKFIPIAIEYFDESLILLKRKLCLSHCDILYKKKNVLAYGYKQKSISPSARLVYERHSHIDHKLYQTMNESLWQQISELGSDFTHELLHFRSLLRAARQYCEGMQQPNDIEMFNSSKWSNGFLLDKIFCNRLDLRSQDYSNLLRKRLDLSTMYCNP